MDVFKKYKLAVTVVNKFVQHLNFMQANIKQPLHSVIYLLLTHWESSGLLTGKTNTGFSVINLTVEL